MNAQLHREPSFWEHFALRCVSASQTLTADSRSNGELDAILKFVISILSQILLRGAGANALV